ncbi:hypothetical protein ACFLZ5_08385 [Thermodesulfobacteriota bacterium]
MPFHEAEQHNKERKKSFGGAPLKKTGHKLRDFPNRPFFMSSEDIPLKAEQQ